MNNIKMRTTRENLTLKVNNKFVEIRYLLFSVNGVNEECFCLSLLEDCNWKMTHLSIFDSTCNLEDHSKMEIEGLVKGEKLKITIVGVLRGVKLSFEALEEEAAPTLVLSNFLMTDAVNLLSSLMGVKLLTDI